MGQPYDDAANAERPGLIEAVRKRDLPKVHPGPRPPAPAPRSPARTRGRGYVGSGQLPGR